MCAFDIVARIRQPRSMDAAAIRLLEALEMYEDGVQIKRESLRRRSPSATDEQIEAEIANWLEGTLDVDSDHVIIPWPRPRR